MKKNAKRILSVVLAAALVVSCAVTGLVVPAAAEGEATAIAQVYRTKVLLVGETAVLPIMPTPIEAEVGTLTWTSENTAVATVKDGTVTAVAPGKTTVTASNGTLSDTCEVAVVENLLKNGNFEDAEPGTWSATNTKVTVESGIGYQGSKGLRINSASGSQIYFQGMDSIKWEPNTRYRISFLAKGPKVRFNSNKITGITSVYASMSTYSTDSTGWQTVYNDIQTGAAPTVDATQGFYFRRESAADADTFIDNVCIYKLTGEDDRFLGGGFEEPCYQQLKTILSRSELAEDETESGNMCLHMPVTMTGDRYIDDLRLDAGREYRLTFRTRGAKAAMYIYNNKSSLASGDGWKTIPASTDWRWVTFTFKTKDGVEATLQSQRNYFILLNKDKSKVSGADAGDTYIDDLHISALPLPKATDIDLNKAKTNLGVGSTTQLTADPVPLKSVHEPLVWSSDNEAIATVDATGLVTAVSVGKTTVRVKSGALEKACEVNVVGAATDFVLRNETLKISTPLGSTKFYNTLETIATPFGSDLGELVWESDAPAVATVDTAGKVTALAAGTATIKVSCARLSISRTCVVTVDPYGDRMIAGDFENDLDGSPLAALKDGSASVVEDPDDETNRVLAMPSGGSSMEARWYNNMPVTAGKTYVISFVAKGSNASIYFSPKYVSTKGDWSSVTLSATEWKKVSYTFTAVETGLNKNYVFGIANRGNGVLYFDDFELVELPDATALAFENSNYAVCPEGSVTPVVKIIPEGAGAGPLTYTSSNPSVMTVDQYGKVTVLTKEGSSTITVKNNKGLSASTLVTVDEYANIICNGDFEGDPYYWRSSAHIQDGIGVDGSRGFLMYGGALDTYYIDNLSVLPATKYILEFDAYTAADSKFRIFSNMMGFGSAYASSKQGWHHHTKIFTTPINLKRNKGWEFAIVNDTDGTTEKSVIDNISVRMYNTGVEAESIKLTLDSVTLAPGRKQSLTIQPTPTDGDINRAVWMTSDPDVATVEYGQVTAVGQGTAIISATTRNGKVATCTVNVSGVPALIKNGIFENIETPQWVISGDAAIEDGVGNDQSRAGVARGGTLTQSFTGLKPKTTYQLFLRYRVNGGKGTATVTDDQGNTLFSESTGTNTTLTASTFEFTTPETMGENFTLTLGSSSSSAVYFDHIILAEKASEVDLVVTDVIWMGAEDQVLIGEDITFAVTITNQGADDVPSTKPFKIDIFVDRERVDQLTYTGELKSTDATVVFGNKPWKAVAGSHTLWAKVNSELDILEKDDTNNTQQVSLYVADKKIEIPEMAGRAGYGRLVFNDEFDSISTVDTTASGDAGYKWYVTRPYGASTLTPDDYKVENGIMTVCNKIPTFNYGLGSTDMKTHNGFSFNQGYIEFRLRIPRPRKNEGSESGVPALWALPLNKLYDIPDENGIIDWVEMDFMEYWGNAYYTITYHDQIQKDAKEIRRAQNSNYSQKGLGDGEWHEMGFVWGANSITAYVDGVKTQVINYQPDDTDYTNAVFHTGLPEDGLFWGMNDQVIALFLGGAKTNPMELDWIRVWQTGGDLPEYEPLPDEEGEGEESGIDIEPEDFQWNYTTDDWGDDIYDVTVENYANIMAGKEIWEGISDDRRAEIDELLEANGQDTFEVLLAKAEILTAGLEAAGMEFLYDCFVNDDGVVDVRVLNSNVDTIHASEDAWNALSEDEQALINEWLVAASGLTFEDMLVASPETGDAYPLMAVAALVLAAALVVFTRKRRVLDK